MKRFKCIMILSIVLILVFENSKAQNLYTTPPENISTYWVSPENPTGEKGNGGRTNKGAKGNAFYIVAPGERKIIFDQKGAGIIKRMWMSGSIAKDAEQRRAVRIDMYWDGAKKPAVSAPIGDFFGIGLGMMVSFDSELFSNPEGRSFNIMIPMPYRESAKIEITNESSTYVLFWYDISFLKVPKIEADAMYFHAYWNRNLKTELGKDYEILPKVNGTGRYLGTNIGVIGDPAYKGTWFGEGEVKIYIDNDKDLPTLNGTGTEDYIGSGYGQGKYYGRYFGSLVSDKENDLYAFYRYHIIDPVYFHKDIRVTIQQMGNASAEKIRELVTKKANLQLVWVLGMNESRPEQIRLLDMEMGKVPEINSNDFPKGYTNFYRSDDVSATAYFYLDRPENNLPELASLELRLKGMQEKVWGKAIQGK
ncbi:MAG: DUF2961 domain-containing protein [Bacteroidia bacterium]|nr:DUF2961 domain-containing protein [Bacteroidia bacterium]